MENLPKTLSRETFISALGHAMVYFLLFVGGAFVAWWKIVSNKPQFAPYKWAVVFGVISLGGVIGFYVYRRRRRKFRPKFDAVDSEVVVERLEIRYQWKSPTEIVYSRQYQLRALKNDVDRFPDKFRWSGNGKCEMRTTVLGHRIERHPPESLYDTFDICFPPLQKGHRITTGVAWDLDDPKCESRPFISRTIHEPTEHLVMIVELPTAWGINAVSTWEAPGAGTKKNVKANQHAMANGRSEWSPESPLRFMHHYEMRWQWPEILRPTGRHSTDGNS